MSDNRLTVQFDAKKIDAIFAQLDQSHLPGAAVGVAIDGTPVYRKGFGLANMELPVVLSPSIRMRVGSINKHFAALAYLLLCEEGRAGIDDTVGKHLPELHPVTHPVTMWQLMGNIGGLRDAHDIRWQFSGTERAVASAEILALYRDIDDVNFAPGSSWCYNNGGWSMVSAVIERITGQSLEEVLRERIFEPVGMHDSLLRRWDTDFVPNSATLHATTPAGGFQKSYLGTALAGEGGMVSTVNDMLRWLAHMDAPIVGSRATWALMKKPQTLPNGTSTAYGFGLITDRYRGVETLQHPGGVLGGSAHILKVPGAGLDVAIMANRGDVFAIGLADQILDVCLLGLDPVKQGSTHPFAAGIFRSPTTGRVVQLFGRDGQQIVSIDSVEMPAAADERGVLWPEGRWFGYTNRVTSVTLSGDPEQPKSIQLSDFGNLDELTRTPPATKVDSSAIIGRYRSEATGTEATIFSTEVGPRLSTVGRFGSAVYDLECLADGIWRATQASAMLWGGILLFDRAGASFRFSGYTTRSLPFRRIGTN